MANAGPYVMGVQGISETIYTPPTLSQARSLSQPIVGEYRTIGMDLQGGLSHRLQTVSERLAKTEAALSTFTAITHHEIVGNLLNASLDSYFAANEVYDTWQAQMTEVVAHRAPSMGAARTVLTTDFVVGIPQKVQFNGIAFEIERLNSIAVGKNNTQRFQRQIGKLGSALAHLVLEQTFGQGNQAVSALRAQASALKSGERIYSLNPETAILPELSLDASAQHFIEQALHFGMHVTLPENPITLDTWTGRGLGRVDPKTGNSHYPTFGTGGQATGILYNDIGQRLVWASLLKKPVRLAPAIKPQIPFVQSVAVGLIPLATDPLKIGLTDKVLTLLTGNQIEQETGPNLPEVLDEHLFSGLLLEHLSLGQLLDPVPPEIDLQLAADSINPGENLQITATASDNGEITNLTVKINDQLLPLDDSGQATFTSEQPGKYTLIVTATDRAGNISRQESSFRVNAPDDTTPPELVIHSPEDGTEITAPTDFVATITDDSLVSWQLAVKSVSNPGLTILGSGSDPIANQPIATFDPTMLTNGLYQVIFQAVDANGRNTAISNSYRVAGDLKVGNFSFTVEDISIDMMGLPLKVMRTYDTRRKGEALDFGQGWSISYQDIKVEESRVPGQYWTLNTYGRRFNQLFCVESLGSPPQITVTFPDGKVEAFEVGVQPRCQSVFQGRPTHLNMVFKPLSGTFSKLEVLDAYAESVYFDGRALLELLNEGRAFNPSLYRLTTQNGYQYEIQQDDIEAQQTPGLKKITEPNGNTLTYTDDGIIHSAGKSILFTRDSQGRITKITDPKGNSLKYQYNMTGDLIASTDFLGNSVRYTYNSTHAMTDMTDPLGRKVVRNLYNDDGRVTGQIDSEGNRTNFNHNLKGRQSIVTDKLGRVTQLYYDGRGNVITQVDPLGNISYSTYDQFGNKLSAIDPLGNATFFKYDDKFNLLEQKDAEGNVVKYTYTKQGKEKTLTDARGNTFENFYDNQGNLIRITDPKGHEISIMLEKGLITSVRDTNDNVTKFTYDKSGNKLTETDPLGNTVTFTYDGNGNELSYSRKRTDASGNQVVETTFYEYDKRNRLIQTTDAFGNINKTQYNTLGQEIAHIDASGRRTDYKYDTIGNLSIIRYSDGTKETRNYDVEGNLLSSTNVAGQTTRYEYDKVDRQIKTIYSDGSVTQTQYDAANRVNAQIDENGNRTEFKYDKVGRRIQSKNADSQITTNAYDADGNLVSKTDNNGNTIAYQYSALDQRIKTIYPGNLVEENIYDKVGNLVAGKDLAGNETQYQYDKLSRLTEVIKSLSDKPISTTFGYDEIGNRISQTDANQNTTTWTYDKLGRVISRTLPLGMTETFAYDKKTGNLLSHTNFNGKTTTFSYDQNTDRLLSTTYADGSVESFTYDVSGNRLLMKAENGTTSYSYDNFHRLIKEVKPNQAVLEYGYDKRSNRTRLKFTEPSGTAAQVQYQYDVLSRLQKVIAPDGETVYLYDSVGNRQQVIYPNGTYTRYAYDKLNRLTALEALLPDNSLLASYQYTLTPTGQRSQIIEHTGRVINYTYDDLYRLKFEKISTTDNDIVFSYQYDAVGNRVYSIEDGVHTKYTYDTNDRLLKQGGVVFQYDANGNTIRITEEKQVVQMSYDGDDRLISVVTEEKGQVTRTVSYAYDADGNRVQTSLNGEVTQYVVDSNDSLAQVIAELDKDDQVKVAYLHGDDLISQYRGNDIHYYHYDGLGSTRGLTDQNAVVTDAYNYEAFGKLLEQIGETENNYLYTGEQFDQNTGNYYLRARYYNPASGRFLSMDSFNGFQTDPITLHKYLYANANPVNMVDPSGQFSLGSLSASISIRGILTGMARFVQLMGVIDFVNDPTAFFYDRLMNRTLRILNRLRFLKWLRLVKKKKRAKKDPSKKDKDEDCPVAGNSFTAETLVHTQRGLITIAEVQIGDQVWSYNEETGEQQWNEVVHLIQGEQEYDLVLLTLENGEIIKATNEHPFFVVEKGWVGAENLTQGDVLVLKEGNIEVVALVREQRKTAVYNLTVANAHNYFVGSDGVLVHNASKKGKGKWADKGPMDICIRLDGTGKVHGGIEYFPKPKDFDRYSREELEDLLDELRKSIKTRIEVTDNKGRDMTHGQRQGNEQKLIKQLEKYLSK
ncbi:MAG TPA: hypothetical protein ENF37_08990 [Beggiatoa sp.]|nr:hypothetical protein [Beggiatoa sp.]